MRNDHQLSDPAINRIRRSAPIVDWWDDLYEIAEAVLNRFDDIEDEDGLE